ncbi:MAG: hypothetical protein IPK68_13525 [Bdellovibrionales bacterium]|nr:hypothetical protein [Bdellovibrionales bacterium]
MKSIGRSVLSFAFISVVGLSQAQDPEAIRNFIKQTFNASNLEEIWIDRNRQYIHQKPEITKWGEGQILIDRTNSKRERKTYQFKVERVSVLPIEAQMKLMSTTCSNIKPNLACEVKARMPIVFASILPAGETSQKEANLKNVEDRVLDIFSAGFPFARKHFPEIAKEFMIKLVCNDWDWIEAGSQSLDIVEVGIVSEESVSDLEIEAKSQIHLTTPKKCFNSSEGCLLSENLAGHPFGFANLLHSLSWYLEVQNQDQACTVEFKSTLSVQDVQKIYDNGIKTPFQPLSTKEKLKSLQDRISPAFIEEWLEVAVSGEGNSDALTGRDKPAVLYRLVTYPLFSFLGLIEESGGSPEK